MKYLCIHIKLAVIIMLSMQAVRASMNLNGAA